MKKMKKTNAILLLLIFAVILSCSDAIKDSTVIVEQNQDIMLENVRFGKGSDFLSPKIIGNSIVYSIALSHSDYYQLTIGDYSTSIFLAPGDSIYVPSEFKKTEYKSFSGDGALLSNYILNDINYVAEFENNTNLDSIYSLSPKEFVKSIDSIYNLRTKRLERFIKSENITDKLFLSTEHKRIFYAASVEKNRYYRDHKFLTKQKQQLNADFNSYLKNADFNNPDLMHLDSYRNFLFTYFEKVGLQQKDRISKDTLFTEIAFEDALNNINNPKTKSYALYRIMDIHLNEAPINKLGKLINDFNENCFNEKYKERINKYYSKIEKLKSGMPAPNFTFPDRNGKSVSLNDFKGKIVYIDVWNSHCSPCFKEFPFLEQLIEKYDDQEIVFLGVSYDSNEKLWKQTLEKKNIKGIQLFANGWNSQFGKDYLIYSNPRFILIDRNGNIIKAKALKPSEHIDIIIDQYL